MTRLWEKETNNPQVTPNDPEAGSTDELEGARRDMRQKRFKATEYLGRLQQKTNPTDREVAETKALNRS